MLFDDAHMAVIKKHYHPKYKKRTRISPGLLLYAF